MNLQKILRIGQNGINFKSSLIKTEEGICYLNVITDPYSRKTVGYAVDETMETESMINALKLATKQKE